MPKPYNLSRSPQQLPPVPSVSAERAIAFEELWAMTPDQRVRAMRAGELTGSQLFAWARRHPEEIPLIDGEWEFIALDTPEVAEALALGRRNLR